MPSHLLFTNKLQARFCGKLCTRGWMIACVSFNAQKGPGGLDGNALACLRLLYAARNCVFQADWSHMVCITHRPSQSILHRIRKLVCDLVCRHVTRQWSLETLLLPATSPEVWRLVWPLHLFVKTLNISGNAFAPTAWCVKNGCRGIKISHPKVMMLNISEGVLERLPS